MAGWVVILIGIYYLGLAIAFWIIRRYDTNPRLTISDTFGFATIWPLLLIGLMIYTKRTD